MPLEAVPLDFWDNGGVDGRKREARIKAGRSRRKATLWLAKRSLSAYEDDGNGWFKITNRLY